LILRKCVKNQVAQFLGRKQRKNLGSTRLPRLLGGTTALESEKLTKQIPES
jgi:hypothetical protein